MKIVVLGGTGLIGSKLVRKLRQLGQEVVAASPETGVNAITGEGLSKALSGAKLVIDLTNSPSFEDQAVMEFFETSGRNLMTAETAARVEHHIILSVVGAERLPESGYLRAKLRQEDLVKNSGIPYTIIYSTQFFEFLGGIALSATEGNIVRLPTALFQPISSDDVVEALARAAIGSPVGGIIEIGGPEKYSMADLVQQYLTAKKDSRQVIGDAHSRYFGTELNEKSLVPDENAHLGSTTFSSWLAEQKSAHLI